MKSGISFLPKNINLGNELIKYLLKILSILLFTVVSLFYKKVYSNIYLFDRTLLIIILSVYFVFSIYDIIALSKNHKLVWIYYILAIFIFVALTAFCNSTMILQNVPLYILFLLLIIVKLQLILVSSIAHNNLSNNDWGFAATGVIVDSTKKKPCFILINNKNLREGKGLWVPPGGHINIFKEPPTKQLISKIAFEIGAQCNVIELLQILFEDSTFNTDKLSTSHTKWMSAPIFLLNEDLFGNCKDNHKRHIDLIYLCIVESYSKNISSKYNISDQVHIDLHRCVRSYRDAEKEVYDTIEKWFKDYHHINQSTKDYVTSDVIWRLHICAKIYRKYNSKIPLEIV